MRSSTVLKSMASSLSLGSLLACQPVPPWTMGDWDVVVRAAYMDSATVNVSVVLLPPQGKLACNSVSESLQARVGPDVPLELVLNGGPDMVGCQSMEFAAMVPQALLTTDEHNTVTVWDGPWSASVTLPALRVGRALVPNGLEVLSDGTARVTLLPQRLLPLVWNEPTDQGLGFVGGVALEDGTEDAVDLPMTESTQGVLLHLSGVPDGRVTLRLPPVTAIPVIGACSFKSCQARVSLGAHRRSLLLRGGG